METYKEITNISYMPQYIIQEDLEEAIILVMFKNKMDNGIISQIATSLKLIYNT